MLTIHTSNLDERYLAESEGFEAEGGSPDEAVGALLREMCLAGYLEGPGAPAKISLEYGHR